MRRTILTTTAALALLAGGFATPGQACTGISLDAGDGALIRGRTLEFGLPVDSSILVIPKGQALTGHLPDGGDGIAYTTKYGMVGANMFGLTGYLDAVNDQGLGAGLFYFPGFADYPPVTPENAGRALAPHEFVVWLLGSFATVEEVKAGLADVVIVATKTPGLGSPEGSVAPSHYFVRDASGKAIAIEPVGGTLVVHDAPLGVMTNSPPYDWHMTNLNNYVNLTVSDVEKATLGAVALEAMSSGTGLGGLPGDFSSPSRFVQASFFAANATPSASGEDAVLTAFHILNQFDIPPGSVSNSAVGGKAVAETTEWTGVTDLTNRRWYFRTFEDQSIRVVDLEAAVAAADGKIIQMSMESKQPILDVSTGPAPE
jgi:choloylglycine hydrolase